MAKKGGVQQLQQDIVTDEEFEKFLERPGLLVLDVYSEWCGPCLGMVGSLKKIKLELGGDNLQLAICKSDTITALKRFCKKSEPTWLFVTEGKAVNLMFGTNVPMLMKMIANELNELAAVNKTRKVYEIDEMQPEEVQRRKVIDDAIAEAIRIEEEEKAHKRHDYLMHVTDAILENLPDIGVTMFGPQVNRDMFKKIMEPADALKISCKDRRVQPLQKDLFQTVHFACDNPVDPEVLEQIDQKELLMCFWKVPEETTSVPDILTKYAHELVKTKTEPPDEMHEHERVVPGILEPMDVEVEFEVEEGIECPVIDEPKSAELPADEQEGEGKEAEEDQGEADEGETADDAGMPMDLDIGLDIGGDEDEDEDEDEEGAETVYVEPEPVKKICRKKVRVPAVWVPNDHRTHATLIYVFFRNQTVNFLPPDPVPEPPHVIMAFDVYKRKDLIGLAERNKDDLPMYGFFTSDDVNEATFIANSSEKYAMEPHTADDKIVFKVNKKTSHTMLSLATYGPSYVSPNTVIGREEALKFFPTSYKTAEQERLEEEQEHATDEPKKKRRTKKGTSISATHGETPHSDGATNAAHGGEAASPVSGASGEESGDSIPPENVTAE